MTCRLAQIERSFLSRWVIATSVGWAAAAPLVWFVLAMLAVMELRMLCQRESMALCFEYGLTDAITSEGFGEIMRMALSSGVLFGLAAGAVIGSLQWLVIRKRVRWSGLWVLATAVGAALIFPGILAGLVSEMMSWQDEGRSFYPGIIRDPISGLLIGFVIGTIQWVALRRHSSRAVWWIPASMIVWTGILANGLIATTSGGFWSFISAVTEAAPAALCFVGPLVGVITGAVLVWIFRSPLQTHEQDT